jgi:hypothetical protein
MNEELLKRLVACKDWRWLPGMLTLCNVRLTEGDSDYLIGHRSGPTHKGGGWVDTTEVEGFLPDLSDPATVGCLFTLVREVWSTKKLANGHSPVVGTSECDGLWEFGYRYGEVRVSCMWSKTEAEVLVWALENGP